MAKRKQTKAPPAASARVGNRPVIAIQAGVFKDRCLQLLDQVNAGTVELIVTKHGTPVARVIAVETEAPSAFGFMRGTVLFQDDIVSPDFDAWGESE